MLGKLIPIVLALVGLGAGVGAGIALRPEPKMVAMDNPCGDQTHVAEEYAPAKMEEKEEATNFDYVKLNNQFVVPIVSDTRVGALVVLSLSLEIELGQAETVYQIEPKLRDSFLQVLFDHANAGGFEGPFTEATRMRILRKSLVETAKSLLGSMVSDVLIIDVVRQDV